MSVESQLNFNQQCNKIMVIRILLIFVKAGIFVVLCLFFILVLDRLLIVDVLFPLQAL